MDDYYELLEIDPDADEATIKEALKQQRRRWSARASSTPELERRQEAERMVEVIDKATEELLDPGRRADYDRRRAEYRRRKAERPPEPQPSEAESPETWAARAEDSMRSGKPRVALHEIDQALRFDHLQPRYHAIKGEAFNAVGAWDDGLHAFRTALELDHGNPVYQLLLGRQLLIGQRHAEALPLLESALVVGGATPDARMLLGQALYGLAEEAADHLPDGTPVIVQPRQAQHVAQLTGRALSLSPPDDRLAHHLQHLHSLALAATQRVFDWKRLLSGFGTAISTSASMGCGCLLMVIGLPIAILVSVSAAIGSGDPAGGFIFLMTLGVGAGVAALCVQPRWKVTERETRQFRVPRVR